MSEENFTTFPEMEYTIMEPLSPFMFLQQENSMFLQHELPEMVPLQQGLEIRNDTVDSITGAKTRRGKGQSSRKKMIEEENNVGEGSNSKKLDHNAKERIRRMRLNESYLSLRALLPETRKSKKGRSAPAIVDRVLKYIPEMESEIEILKQVRDNMQSDCKNKQLCADQDPTSQFQGPTVSVTEVKIGEVILQICTRKDHGGFSNMLQNIEAQDIYIRSASMLDICDDAVCYQLHIEMNKSSQDYEPKSCSELREKPSLGYVKDISMDPEEKISKVEDFFRD